MKANIRLKILRVKKQLTQKELSEKLNMSVTAYSYVESGKRQGSFEFWEKVQNVFQVKDSEMWEMIINR